MQAEFPTASAASVGYSPRGLRVTYVEGEDQSSPFSPVVNSLCEPSSRCAQGAVATASAATTSEAEGSVECVGGVDERVSGNARCRPCGNAPAGSFSAKETVNAELLPRAFERRFTRRWYRSAAFALSWLTGQSARAGADDTHPDATGPAPPARFADRWGVDGDVGGLPRWATTAKVV